MELNTVKSAPDSSFSIIQASEKLNGFRIAGGFINNDYSAFEGQTNDDWSACYSQFTPEHALRYLPTRYETFNQVSLIKITFNSSVQFIKCNQLDEIMKDSSVSSSVKSNKMKEFLFKNSIPLNSEAPLMKDLGRLGYGLICFDNDTDQEFVIPHSIMTNPNLITFTTIAKFVRDDSCIFKTNLCFVGERQINLTKEERIDFEQLSKRILFELEQERISNS